MAYAYSTANMTTGLVPTTDISYMLRAEHTIVTAGSAFDLKIPDNANLRIAGDITAGEHAVTDAGRIDIYQSVWIHVMYGSLIQTEESAISLDGPYDRRTHGGSFRLRNEGEIVSADGGVDVFGGAMTIANAGQISSVDAPAIALHAGTRNPGMFVLKNTGTLTTETTGQNISEPTVYLNASQIGRVWFRNEGLIEAGDGHAVWTYASYARIVNSGTINGRIDVYGDTSSSIVRIINSGLISADDRGHSLNLNAYDVQMNNSGIVEGSFSAFDQRGSLSASVTVLNSGTFSQNVNLGFADDFYQGLGTGIVTGTVYGNFGDDLLRGGELDDRFDGGDGNDTLRSAGGDDDLYGNNNDDRMFGGDGNDTMNGGNGADTIIGDAGDDQLLGRAGDDFGRGGDGNDLIYAGANNDWFYGGFGNDTLYGEGGDDRLYGDAGDDEIDGGLGRDVIYTGDGLDVIIFNDAADSAVGAQRDVIYDFEQGSDLIDVTGVVGGLFSFVGTGAFTGTANEIRLIESGGSTRVQMDTDADGTVDSEIFLKGAVGLTADDFLL